MCGSIAPKMLLRRSVFASSWRAGCGVSRIPVLALGTYYKYKSPNEGPNAYEMQRLCWWAKQDPNRQNSPFSFFPVPGQRVTIDSKEAAYDYAAQAISSHVTFMRKAFGVSHRKICIVPVPSSSVTPTNYETERWSGREIGIRLAALGVGRLCLAAVNRRPAPKKSPGTADATWFALQSYLVRTQNKIFPTEIVLYVDEILTWGRHLWALHAFLGEPHGACASVIGCTDSATRDALKPQARLVFMGNSDVEVTEFTAL